MGISRDLVALVAGTAALLGAGCAPPPVAELGWTGLGEPGDILSAEWIKYRTTSDITFTGDLTLNFFVLSTLPNFCGAYQQAVGDSADAFAAFTDAREPFRDADDLRNPQVCELTVDYYTALSEATAPLTEPGTFYVNTSFGFAGAGIVIEEGVPQEGIFEMTDSPLVEDGDFFRTLVRFYEDNPYRLAAESLDCSDPSWGDALEQVGYTEFVGERRADGSGGTLQSEMVNDELVHIAHTDVLTVNRTRTAAGALDSNAEYLLCEISTHEFFLRIFER